MLSWNGPYGWFFAKRNSPATWPQIDRKRTREQLRALVNLLNYLRRVEIDDR
jgi:hypothetical protein